MKSTNFDIDHQDEKKMQPLEVVQKYLPRIPYAEFIGIEILEIGSEFVFKMRPKNSNIGNPALPALHGGVIAAFMETCAILTLMAYTGGTKIPKVVDMSFDYLRSGKVIDTYAICDLTRMGTRVVNLKVNAWQTKVKTPIASARGHLIWPD